MNTPTIVILGGYGNTGRALAGLLLEHSPARLILAGRSGEKAQAAATAWNDRFPGERVSGRAADAADGESLADLFRGAEAEYVVVASSTSPHARQVAAAALQAGLHYMDPQYSSAKLRVLRELQPAVEAAGLCFVTDSGFHPGLPAALVRYAAGQVERLHSARVGSVIQVDWRGLEFSPATIEELVVEFLDYQALHFRNGRWQNLGWLESLWPIWMDFGHGFGRRYTMPMFLEELRPLPELLPGLQATGFYVGGFNPVVDWLILPAALAWLKLSPRRGLRPVGRLLLWGLKRFAAPPYGTLLRLEAEGARAGAEYRLVVEIYHPDGYVLTAAPMAACLLQMLDGSALRPGLHFQALLVDPGRLLADLQRMGVEVRTESVDRAASPSVKAA